MYYIIYVLQYLHILYYMYMYINLQFNWISLPFLFHFCRFTISVAEMKQNFDLNFSY